ncbi:MAG: hypothetical protein ACO3LE_08715 [Bdellovibrionota bacterium]
MFSMLKLRLKIKTFILLSLNLLMFLLLGAEAQAEAVNRGGQTFETSTENPNANDEAQKPDQNSKEISEADQNPVAAIMPKPGENLRRTLSEEETFKQQALVKLNRAGIPNPTDEQIEEEIKRLKKELRAESNEVKRQTAVAAAPASGGGSSGSGVGIGILAAGGIALAALAITSSDDRESPEIEIQTESLWSDTAFRSRAIDSYDYTYTDASGEPNLAQIDLFDEARTREYLENHGVKQGENFWGNVSWEKGVDEMIEENPDLPADQVARLRAMATSLDATDKMFAKAEDGDVDFYCQGGAEVQDHCKSFFDSVPSIANFVKAKQQVLQLESVSPENQGEDWKPALNKAKAQVNSFAAKLRAQASALLRARDDQSSPQGKRLLENVALLFEATAEKVAESNDREELEKLFKALDGKDWNDYVKAHEKFGLLESELSSGALRDTTKATRDLLVSAMNPSLSYAELSTGELGAGETRHPSLGRGGSQGRVTPDGDSLDLRASGGRL